MPRNPKQLLPPMDTTPEDKERYRAAFDALISGPTHRIRLGGPECLYLITAVQLACHTPQFHGMPKQSMIGLANVLRGLIAQPGSPIDRAIQMGWDHIPPELQPKETP